MNVAGHQADHDARLQEIKFRASAKTKRKLLDAAD